MDLVMRLLILFQNYSGEGDFTTSNGSTINVSDYIDDANRGETNTSGSTIVVTKSRNAIMVDPDGNGYQFSSPQEVPNGFTVFEGESFGQYFLPTYSHL